MEEDLSVSGDLGLTKYISISQVVSLLSRLDTDVLNMLTVENIRVYVRSPTSCEIWIVPKSNLTSSLSTIGSPKLGRCKKLDGIDILALKNADRRKVFLSGNEQLSRFDYGEGINRKQYPKFDHRSDTLENRLDSALQRILSIDTPDYEEPLEICLYEKPDLILETDSLVYRQRLPNMPEYKMNVELKDLLIERKDLDNLMGISLNYEEVKAIFPKELDELVRVAKKFHENRSPGVASILEKIKIRKELEALNWENKHKIKVAIDLIITDMHSKLLSPSLRSEAHYMTPNIQGLILSFYKVWVKGTTKKEITKVYHTEDAVAKVIGENTYGLKHTTLKICASIIRPDNVKSGRPTKANKKNI